MKHEKLMLVVSLIFLRCAVVFADTQHITVSSPFEPMADNVFKANVEPNITQATAEINNDAQGAEAILKGLVAKLGSRTITNFDKEILANKNFYAIFHLLKWTNPDSNDQQTIQAENWYLYHRGKLTIGSSSTIPRLYGAKDATFIFIHLNKDPDNQYTPLYRFDVEKKTPAYIGHLLDLAGLAGAITGANKSSNKAANAPPEHWWGMKTLAFEHRTADITATPKLTRQNTTVEDMGDVQKFDNEGKYYVDFSVGVPVRKMSELNFNSTNNTVTANDVDKTKLFAFVNLYLKPVDIKSSSPNLVPHFVGGVAIDKQPLHKIFVGGGFGPIVANFYIGALFVKQEELTTLNPGDTATASQVSGDVRRKFKPQVAFGLNVPVGAIIEKLKGK